MPGHSGGKVAAHQLPELSGLSQWEVFTKQTSHPLVRESFAFSIVIPLILNSVPHCLRVCPQRSTMERRPFQVVVRLPDQCLAQNPLLPPLLQECDHAPQDISPKSDPEVERGRPVKHLGCNSIDI